MNQYRQSWDALHDDLSHSFENELKSWCMLYLTWPVDLHCDNSIQLLPVGLSDRMSLYDSSVKEGPVAPVDKQHLSPPIIGMWSYVPAWSL